MPGVTISFTLSEGGATLNVGSAVTNASGVATLSIASLSGFSAGDYPGAVGASVAAASTYGASSAVGSLSVLPSPVTVRSLKVATIKLGTGKRAKKTTALVLQLSGALNKTQASSLAAFHLYSGTVKKGHTAFKKSVPLRLVDYNPATQSIALIPRSKLDLSRPEELVVTAADLTDSFGEPLDGNGDGRPGGNYVAILNGKRVTTAASLPAAAIVDAILEPRRMAR